MIYNGLRPDSAEEDEDPSQHHGFWKLALTGFATSIDAMAVGIGLAFMDVHIGVMATVIGLCTLTMVTVGIMLGRVLGSMVGKRAEIIGGVILVIIGATILYEHLHGGVKRRERAIAWLPASGRHQTSHPRMAWIYCRADEALVDARLAWHGFTSWLPASGGTAASRSAPGRRAARPA